MSLPVKLLRSWWIQIQQVQPIIAWVGWAGGPLLINEPAWLVQAHHRDSYTEFLRLFYGRTRIYCPLPPLNSFNSLLFIRSLFVRPTKVFPVPLPALLLWPLLLLDSNIFSSTRLSQSPMAGTNNVILEGMYHLLPNTLCPCSYVAFHCLRPLAVHLCSFCHQEPVYIAVSAVANDNAAPNIGWGIAAQNWNTLLCTRN